MKPKLSRSLIAILTVGVSLLVIGLIVIFPGWFDGHAGVAAWVQAIGAIAIVLATSWIAGLSFTEERRRRREGEQQLWEAVATMSERCIECLYEVVKATEFTPNPRAAFMERYRPSDLNAPMDGLATVPLHQLGDVQMVAAVISLRRVTARVRTELDEFYEHLTTPSVSRGLNVQALIGYKTEVFNAHACIVRLTYGSAVAAEKLRRFA
jgi:hypothetical protein